MKKSLKRVFSLLLVVTALVTLVACGGNNSTPSTPVSSQNNETQSPQPSGDPIVIRFAVTATSSEFEDGGTTPMGIGCNYFISEIESRSNGRITVQFFPDGQLASSTTELFGGLKNGAFDMTVLSTGAWGEYTSAFAGLNMPYLYTDYDLAYAVLDSEIGQSWMRMAHDATGCLPLAWFDVGFRQLTCNKAVHSPDDLKGMKVRVMVDPIQTATWEALGCAVTPVQYSELYTALQQGMVDAQENPPSNIVASKLYELQDYMILTNHNFTTTLVTLSDSFWSKLSAEDQQLITEVLHEAQEAARAKIMELDEKLIGQIADSGTEFIRLTSEELAAFTEATTSVWPMVEQQMGSEAFNALIDFVEKYNG